MRRDMFARHGLRVVVLFVNLDLVAQPRNIRDINLDRAVTQGLHELVVLQTPVFRFVGVPQDDFIDIGLSELLRLDLVFLAGPQEIVKEGHIQLEDFHEFHHAPVGDVEFAIEIKGARIAIAAVFGNLAVVDVARQFGRILILFILGLEGPDPNPIFLAQQ